ncbi:unnamed protein product [Prorocentrum cordatum]|uniref:Kinesin-like protein n=1 Tax=Prorocentrum cordatum TaxID=2364126 RepID=A0ABN9SEX4_9DINO|nr:unnamed protein product [Polarella glacialis]
MEGADDWPAPDGGRLERAESWCEDGVRGQRVQRPRRRRARAAEGRGQQRGGAERPGYARAVRSAARPGPGRAAQPGRAELAVAARAAERGQRRCPAAQGGLCLASGDPDQRQEAHVPTASPRPNGFARPRPRGSLAAALSEAAAGSPEAGRPAGRDSVRDSLGIVEPAGAPAHGPPGRPKGDVAVCVRLRPGPRHDVCISVQNANCVRLQCWDDVRGTGNSGPIYWCDHAFGPEASQEEVYDVAVAPICASVLEGYNGAVLAYGQTGSGKTHTIIGDAQHRGVIPRAVATIIDTLRDRRHWSVEVCMLEIYNERTRDLLAPGQSVCQVDIHEVQDAAGVSSFQCPGATRRAVRSAEEVLSALVEGLRRRETAHTDMNHNSSRSHLIFTLDVTQVDDALGATLRGRLHLVDLAGSERLKRSMASQASSVNERDLLPSSKSPRDLNAQRKEAGAINKSLAQLALVIQRLSSGGSLRHVPYRDSMLTRLLADSFGGSSKTCLIITCSSLREGPRGDARHARVRQARWPGAQRGPDQHRDGSGAVRGG